MASGGHRAALLAQGVDFPALPGDTGGKAHVAIANHLRGVEPERADEIATLLAAGLSRSPVCLLSTENFYQCDNPAVLAPIAGPDSRVVLYLREPVAHLVSIWKQAVKSKRMGKPTPRAVFG